MVSLPSHRSELRALANRIMIVVSLAYAFTWSPWHQTDLKLNTRTFALSHSMHISTRNTGIPRRWTETLEKPCSSVYKVPLTKNSLEIPLVAGKEVSGRKLIKRDCCTVLLFFKERKKDPRISWNMYTDNSCPSFLDEPREEILATQAIRLFFTACVAFRLFSRRVSPSS